MGSSSSSLLEAEEATTTAPVVDYDWLLRLGRDFLLAVGEDPDRPGLKDTPRRFAEHWREFFEFDAGRIDTAFPEKHADEMVIVSGIPVHSFCEHHLLPFSASISIGYIAADEVLGLSKFARIALKYAHRLQLQERLVRQIAEHVSRATNSPDVIVVARGSHSCMKCRGVKSDGEMVCSKLLGRFKHDAAMRAEFLTLSYGGLR